MNRNTLLVSAVVVAFGLAGGLWLALAPSDEAGTPTAAAPSPAPAATPSATTTTAASAPLPAPAVSVAPASAPAPAPDGTASAEPAPLSPSFDIVRVEKDGSAVIAGRAAPGATVHLFDGDQVIAEAKAGSDGSFAIVLDKPLAQGNRRLSLASTDAGGTLVPSEDEVVVVVAGAGQPAAAASASASAAQQSAEAAVAAVEAAAAAPEEPAAATTASETTAAADATSSPEVATTAEAAPAPSPAPATTVQASQGASTTTSGETASATGEAATDESATASSAETQSTAAEAAEGQASETQATETQASETQSTETQATETQATGTQATGTQATQVSETEAAETQVADTPKLAEQLAAEQPVVSASAAAQSQPQVAAVQPAEPLVVIQPKSGQGASQVLQGAAAPAGTKPTVAIEAVDYDLTGQVVVSGQGQPGAQVLIYLDHAVLGQATVGDDGRWQFTPEQAVAAGLHRLRADLVGADGSVVARSEIPFQRAEPIQVAADEEFIVVQPGNSLWVIADKRYGQGVQYTAIYAANASQIRNPDLIYPGQIFLVPTVN